MGCGAENVTRTAQRVESDRGGSQVTAVRPVQDRYLPPDRDAYAAGEPATGRVIVIAPTRAACETIELAVGLHLETVLEREHGTEIRELAAEGAGFGIVAGTGTGKTLAIRPIAETILGKPLRVGVVNREREATPETPSWNVVIVTDRKSTRLNSSHPSISYAVFCLKKKM